MKPTLRWIPLVVMGLTACPLTSEGGGCGVSLPHAVEPALSGPLLSAPELGVQHDPDPLASDAAVVWFAWTHPHMRPMDTVELRISAVPIGDSGSGRVIATIAGVPSEAIMTAGHFSLPWGDAEHSEGLYRAEVLREGAPFASVTFSNRTSALGSRNTRGETAYRAGDLEVASGHFEVGCEAGDQRACWNLGYLHQRGQGTGHDIERARALFEGACDAGEARGCTDLGLLLLRGVGSSVDETRARGLFQRSCDGGEHQGCHQLALMYARGTGGDLELDRAAELFEGACGQGFQESCTQLARVYRSGRGRDVDLVRAAAVYADACAAGGWAACADLGEMYAEGMGVERDTERARELLRTACQEGVATACARFSRGFESGPEPTTPTQTP